MLIRARSISRSLGPLSPHTPSLLRCFHTSPRTTALRCLPSMVSASDVRKRLGELLPTLDMDNTTERMIRNQLAKEMGDISSLTKVIKTTIESFLEDVDNDEGENDENAEQGIKREANILEGNTQKRAKIANPTTGSGEYSLSLGGMKMLKVSPFKGKMMVDIREYYTDKASGEDKPGKSGISLNVDQWIKLRAALPSLRKALEEGDDSTVAELGNMKRAYASQYKSKWSVHVREMYEGKNEELLPGKKGITLDTSMLGTLSDNSSEISSYANPNGTDPGPSAAPPPRAAAAAAPPTARAAPAAASSSPAGDDEGDGDATFVDLGGMKRASISNFKNNVYVDLREWYSKDGNALPGKKGISLAPAEWQKVIAAAPGAKEAVQKGNLDYSVEIKTNRRVALSEFKGKTYVGVREYYEKDGKHLPGVKGLNMSVEQWDKLMAGAARISSMLEKAAA